MLVIAVRREDLTVRSTVRDCKSQPCARRPLFVPWYRLHCNSVGCIRKDDIVVRFKVMGDTVRAARLGVPDPAPQNSSAVSPPCGSWCACASGWLPVCVVVAIARQPVVTFQTSVCSPRPSSGRGSTCLSHLRVSRVCRHFTTLLFFARNQHSRTDVHDCLTVLAAYPRVIRKRILPSWCERDMAENRR